MGNITAADVKKLRDATGAGMMDCKKALTEADGDHDKAVEILRVSGQAKAAKRGAERSATNGLVAFTVQQSTQEIGIRMAVGARDGQVAVLFVRQVMLLVAAGVGLGLAGAAGLTRLMESLLFGVTALDPLTYVAGAVTLLVAAALAGYFPARRVTRVDPMQALRQE